MSHGISTLEERFHDAYREFMLAHGQRAQEDFRALLADLEHGHAKYAGKVLKLFFHPYVLGPELYAANVEATAVMAEILEKVARLYYFEPSVRAQFGFDPRVEELITGVAAPVRAAPVVRFDSFIEGRQIRFVEVNTDGSSGMNDTNEVEERFLACPLVGELCRGGPLAGGGRPGWTLSVMPMVAKVLEAILEAYSKDPPDLPGHPLVRPTIAIVDWKGVKTEAEFFAMQEQFERAGYPTIVVDPRALGLEGRRLVADGRPIDIVYKRVLTAELLERWSEVQPLIEGYRRGAYTQVGSYLGEVLYDKGVLAFVSDPANASRFTPEERERIGRHVPWTRRVKPGPVVFDGETHELLELLERHRERFVVKPANAYGGAGVCVGEDASAREWRGALEHALKERFIAQELVRIPTEKLFMVESGTLAEKKVNVGQFLFGGKFAGLYCRVSDASVINVAAGGATLPCFRLEAPAA